MKWRFIQRNLVISYTVEFFSLGTNGTNALGVEGTIYRLYNHETGEHIYTADKNEMIELSSWGWSVEKSPGITSWLGIPVYRLFNSNSGEHLYTTDTNEISVLISRGWVQDGFGAPIFYGDEKGNKKVYRLFNASAQQIASHHYTSDQNEIKVLLASGWKYDNNANPAYTLK